MNSLSQLSQPQQPTEPDMALLFPGSLFETVDCTLLPERDEAKLDAQVPALLTYVGYWGKTGKHLFGLSFTGFDRVEIPQRSGLLP